MILRKTNDLFTRIMLMILSIMNMNIMITMPIQKQHQDKETVRYKINFYNFNDLHLYDVFHYNPSFRYKTYTIIRWHCLKNESLHIILFRVMQEAVYIERGKQGNFLRFNCQTNTFLIKNDQSMNMMSNLTLEIFTFDG